MALSSNRKMKKIAELIEQVKEYSKKIHNIVQITLT